MSASLYLDEAPGEIRACVWRDGVPEALLVERAHDPAGLAVGAEFTARVRQVEVAIGAAFMDLGEGREAFLPLGPGQGAPPREGEALRVRVSAPPRRGKSALVASLGPGEGAPRLLVPAPPIRARLQALAPQAPITTGREAREAADGALEAALRPDHGLPSGGRIFVETTRALTSVDVDAAGALGDRARLQRRLNLEALAVGARVLRLKGLGGLVVFDLIGRGHDGEALSKAARAAFQPEGDEVVIGRVSRLGLFEIALPRRRRPLAEIFLGDDGQETVTTLALRLLRAIEDAAEPGRLVDGRAEPGVAKRALELAPALLVRIGSRFRIDADAGLARDAFKVTAR